MLLGRVPVAPWLVGAMRPPRGPRPGSEAAALVSAGHRSVAAMRFSPGSAKASWAASAHEAAAKRARASTEATSSSAAGVSAEDAVRVHEWGGGALLPARLVRRYKRFLADCVLLEDDWETPMTPSTAHVGRGETPKGGEGQVTVHCPNPGAMLGMLHPTEQRSTEGSGAVADGLDGQLCRLSMAKGKGRKLPLTLEQLRVPVAGSPTGQTQWIGCNTQLANSVVATCLERGLLLDKIGPFDSFRREVVYGREGRSRVDFVLSRSSAGLGDLYVEVKNVTYIDGGLALFPDCVSKRATKHLDDLMHVSSDGQADAAVIFFVNAGDLDGGAGSVTGFAPAVACDPTYASRYWEAVAAGVKMIAPKFAIDPATGDVCFVGYAEPTAG